MSARAAPRRRAVLLLLAAGASACATDRVVTWEDLGAAAAPTVPNEAAPSKTIERDPGPVNPAPAAPTASTAPIAPTTSTSPSASTAAATSAAPVDLGSRGAVVLPGFGRTVDDGSLVAMEAMTLVCLADSRSLSQTALVFERLDAEADKAGLKLGEQRLVRVQRDPARSVTDPPPRACRTLVGEAALHAPLARESEASATWLVTASGTSVVDDAVRARARMEAGGHTATAAPRALVDASGSIVAFAIPVGPRAAGAGGR